MTSPYATLLELSVDHRYFADPARFAVRFRPDAATASWLQSAGCVVRTRNNMLRVFYPAGRSAPSVAPTEPVVVRFAATPCDPGFSLYTVPPPAPGVYYFSSDGAVPGDDGRFVLQQAAAADPEAAVDAGLDGTLRVKLSLQGNLADADRRYVAFLDSRSTLWSYILTGVWPAQPLWIAQGRAPMDQPQGDAAATTVAFTRLTPDPILPDGRPAIAFESDKVIPLRDAAPQRFELWSAGDAGGRPRCLVKPLPVAAPQNLANPDPTAGPAKFSEIFVSAGG